MPQVFASVHQNCFEREIAGDKFLDKIMHRDAHVLFVFHQNASVWKGNLFGPVSDLTPTRPGTDPNLGARGKRLCIATSILAVGALFRQ